MPGVKQASEMLHWVSFQTGDGAFDQRDKVIAFILSPIQVPQRDPDHVPPHLALPDHSRHYKQGCPQASAGSEGFGEGHPAGT